MIDGTDDSSGARPPGDSSARARGDSDAQPSRKTGSGPGRLLVAVYGVFALAASARAGVQISTHFDDAPLAYLLSALAAVVYIVATIALALGNRGSRRVATGACLFELTGVLVVGTLSLFDAQAFPDATVWSIYGKGYGFVPLVLPVIGLLWIRHTRARP